MHTLALGQGRPHLLAVQEAAPLLPPHILQEWARACMLGTATSQVMPAAVMQAAVAQGTDSALFRCVWLHVRPFFGTAQSKCVGSVELLRPLEQVTTLLQKHV